MSANLESTTNELLVITDTVDRQRARIASLAEPFVGADRDEVLSAVYEAERQLMMSVRTLRRAIKTLEQQSR